jgi:hypothetical protein
MLGSVHTRETAILYRGSRIMPNEIESAVLQRVSDAGDDGLVAREVVQESRAGAAIRLGGAGYLVDQATYEALEGLAADGLLHVATVRAVLAGRGTATKAVFRLSDRGRLRLAAARAEAA